MHPGDVYAWWPLVKPAWLFSRSDDAGGHQYVAAPDGPGQDIALPREVVDELADELGRVAVLGEDPPKTATRINIAAACCAARALTGGR